MDAAVARHSKTLLIACDLDGTLLDCGGAPVPGAGEALAGLIAAGALFVVCTGRPLQSARRATAALGVEPAMFACYHGALVAEAGGTIVRHLPLPRRAGVAVAAWALRRGLGCTVYDVDEPRELEWDAGPDEEPGGEVSRLVLHGEPAQVARLQGELRIEWAGRLRIEQIRPGFIGVFAPQVDKGEALRFIAGRMGVPLARTVACGDGTADETLLATAAVRIAVGETPHVLGEVPGVIVTSPARLAETLHARVLPLL